MFDKEDNNEKNNNYYKQASDQNKPNYGKPEELELKVDPRSNPSAPSYQIASLPKVTRGGRPAMMVANASSRQEWPSDYLCWSILNICCGSWIFGAFALIFSIQTIKNNRLQNFRSAGRSSELSFNFNLTASIFAIITWVAIIAFIIISANYY